MKTMFPHMFSDSLYDISMWLAEVFSIDLDIIEIYHNQDIKLFSEDLVNITLKPSRCIKKTKRYDLVLEVTVFDMKNCFLFITFSNSYLMIDTSEIQLGKPLSLT